MIPFGPTVHVLNVTLRDVKPAVWRRIVVKSETPLPKLARMLESAMGWEGYHLRYPLCLDGKRACPPDDCGGTTGYEELLQVLADPSDPGHEHMVSRAPEGFDPEEFDLVGANRRLRSP